MGQQQSDAAEFHKDIDKPGPPGGDENDLNFLSVSSIPEKALSAQELEQLAKRFDDACNGGFLGIGTDFEGVLEALSKVPENQMKDFDQAFRKLHDKDWGVAKELDDELEGHDHEIANNLFNARAKNVELRTFFEDVGLRNRGSDFLKMLRTITGGETKVEPLRLSNISTNSKYRPYYNQFERLSAEPYADGSRREQVLFDSISPDKRRRLAAELLHTKESIPSRVITMDTPLSERRKWMVNHTDEYKEFASSMIESREATQRAIRTSQEQFKMTLPEDAKRDLDAHLQDGDKIPFGRPGMRGLGKETR